jgi:uncharacterized protein (DUF3084 family)
MNIGEVIAILGVSGAIGAALLPIIKWLFGGKRQESAASIELISKAAVELSEAYRVQLEDLKQKFDEARIASEEARKDLEAARKEIHLLRERLHATTDELESMRVDLRETRADLQLAQAEIRRLRDED